MDTFEKKKRYLYEDFYDFSSVILDRIKGDEGLDLFNLFVVQYDTFRPIYPGYYKNRVKSATDKIDCGCINDYAYDFYKKHKFVDDIERFIPNSADKTFPLILTL